MKKYGIYGIIIGILFSLAGCGKDAPSNTQNEYAMDYGHEANYSMDTSSAQETMAYEGYEEANPTLKMNDIESKMAAAADRKLIKTVSMTVETEEFDNLIADLQRRIEEVGGYIEQSDINGNSLYMTSYNRSASLDLRVPSDKLDSFVNKLGEISNVTWQNEYIQDITLEYIDVESHKTALETEQKRLLELLEKAESVEDIIAIESRLTDVRYYLQNYESQLRAMDNQISYSTIYLEIREVKRFTPSKERSIWEEIKDGFADSIASIGMGFKHFFVNAVIYIPYLVMYAVVICILFIIGRKIWKRKRNRKEQRNNEEDNKK